MDAPPAPAAQCLGEKIQLLEAAVADADKGVITNAKKMEGLAALEELIPSIPREVIVKQQTQLEDLCERLLAQNATEPLRRLVVSVLNCFYRFGNSAALPTFFGKLLTLSGEEKNKKVATDTKVAALDVMGELIVNHGRSLEHFSTDIFVVVAKHMKLNEASARCSAFNCLRKVMRVASVRSTSIASNIWKMLQKMLLDKAVNVRACAARALADLASASPSCVGQNGDAMAMACLKALATDDQVGQCSLSSECRFAFSMALANILATLATPGACLPEDRPKKKPEVTDLASAAVFLEKAAAKGPPAGAMFVAFRASICLVAVRLVEVLQVNDAPSISLVMRVLVAILDGPQQIKASRGAGASSGFDEESLAQVGRYISGALRRLLQLAASETVLLEVIETGLIPLASSQFTEASRNTDARMVVVLEALSSGCTAAGEAFRGAESKVSKPLLHLVGNHPNPTVQLSAAYCLRVVACSSPPQLFQIMSFLLNLVTVQNAELLGTPLPRRAAGTPGAAKAGPDLQPLMRGLFGHCAALASLVGELFRSDLGVPHDVTNAVLNTSRALLQPHLNTTLSAQRRSCAFILLEGLMCLGTDWVGQRLTTLFALWKAALGKKPVDRAKVLHQQHVASASQDGGPGQESSSGACRDELLSLLCALRSLHAFTLHSHDTLLVSLPHLHKILVVFLTHVSQLVVALPHPTSASFRAKCRNDSATPGHARPTITLAVHCGIPDVLLMIRSTMYRCFAVTQYSQRFVPLLNMLADDVTRPLPLDFPVADFVAHYLNSDDVVLDLVDPYMDSSRDSAATVRLATARLLSTSLEGSRTEPGSSSHDPFCDAASSGFFSGAPREGPGSIDGMLTPWDAWADPKKTMASQGSSPEWEWRCSAVALLAIIMNSSEVSEAPRSAVLTHLLKKRESAEDSSGGHGKKGSAPQCEVSVVASVAILVYLREHARARGIKCGLPAAPAEQILQVSLEGLRDANPAIRRLHVEILSLLFYIHHRLPESPIVPSILQFLGQESSSDSAPVRSALALLCGSVLRAFEWGGALQSPPGAPRPQGIQCPYLINIVPCLLKLAKETAQPVRLWMLHGLHLSMQAAKLGFSPFLKECLRLATAHLLADFFESPLVLWTIGELLHSAAAMPPAEADTGGANLREEHAQRILGIWSVMKHVRYTGAGSGAAFATVRTEALCILAAQSVVQLASGAPKHVKDISELLSAKLAPRRLGGSLSAAARVAAALCVTELVGMEAYLGQTVPITRDPFQLFVLLNEGTSDEAAALTRLVLALVRRRGLAQLPMWLQTFKEVILALPKGSGPVHTKEEAAAAQDRAAEEHDAHDDGAAIAGASTNPSAGADENSRPPSGATKAFAVSCLQTLLEQADPADASHFQCELSPGTPSSKAAAGERDCRLVNYLEIMVSLAAHACGSDEPSLAAAGLRLALLIVSRFRLTRDVQGQTATEDCPLLLVQFEAQMTTCIRHNMSPGSNPRVQALALELLRDMIATRACNSVQPLTMKLMQPFGSAAFEPDEKYCECASTKTFLFRLRSACEVLDSSFEEPTIGGHVKDLARWMESALRDSAVLLAGLPLPSIKTYQPACFCLADYKAVQPFFQETLPPILRGVCVLCRDAKLQSVSSDFVALALGIVVLLLGDASRERPEAELRVYVRLVKQAALHAAMLSHKDAGCAGPEAGPGSVVTTTYLLDMLQCLWQRLFRVPARCAALLPDLLELLHALSAAMFRHRQKQEAPVIGLLSEVMWLDGLCQDTEQAQEAWGTVGAYALHAVAAALRNPEVAADAARVSQALEVFVLWLGDSLADGPEEEAAGSEDDEVVAAALAGESVAGLPGCRGCGRRHWLWLLFLSPFPAELVHAQPAVTLKFWKMVCGLLCKPRQGGGQSDRQLLHLALVASRLCRELLPALDRAEAAPEAEERHILYQFALLVPAVASICAVLQGVQGGADGPAVPLRPGAKAAARQCLGRVELAFSRGLQHQSPKVVQTAISSAQGLLQSPACAMLCPGILPGLTAVFASPGASAAALDGAWGAVSAMLAAQQATGGATFTGATTRMVLHVVLAVLDCSSQQPGSFGAHTEAMARCLVQVARTDAQGVRAAVAAMAPERQATIQQLMRNHMSTAGARGAGASSAAASAGPGAASKISLKLKF